MANRFSSKYIFIQNIQVIKLVTEIHVDANVD